MRHLFLRQTGARPRLDQDRDKGELLFQRFILAPRTSFSVGVFEPSEPRVLKLGYAHQGTESFCERCEEGHNGIELPVVRRRNSPKARQHAIQENFRNPTSVARNAANQFTRPDLSVTVF